MHIGNRIEGVRTRAGLTQREFATRIGTTGPSVSKWERGLNSPSVEVATAICREFSVKAAWLLFGEPEEQGGLSMASEAGAGSAKPNSRTVLEEKGGSKASSMSLLDGWAHEVAEPHDKTEWQSIASLESPPTTGAGPDENLARLLAEVRGLASNSQQTQQIQILKLVATQPAISLESLARRLGIARRAAWLDVVALQRRGLLEIKAEGEGLNLTLPDRSVDIEGETPFDGSQITRKLVGTLLADVLPKADRQDGSGGVAYIETQTRDGRAMLKRILEAVRLIWREAEEDVGEERVRLVLGGSVDLEDENHDDEDG